MRNVDLFDVRVMDGYVLRFVMVHQLNEYVMELNCMYKQLSEFDFDVTDMIVYYAYQKLFQNKVERFRALLYFLRSVDLVSKRTYKSICSRLDEMVKKTV